MTVPGSSPGRAITETSVTSPANPGTPAAAAGFGVRTRVCCHRVTLRLSSAILTLSQGAFMVSRVRLMSMEYHLRETGRSDNRLA